MKKQDLDKKKISYRISVWLQLDDGQHRVENEVVGGCQLDVLLRRVSDVARDFHRVFIAENRFERWRLCRRVFHQMG